MGKVPLYASCRVLGGLSGPINLCYMYTIVWGVALVHHRGSPLRRLPGPINRCYGPMVCTGVGRTRHPVGPYSRTMPRLLRRS